MRQLVSLIKDNQVHYGLVDSVDGTLIPFANVTLPDPDSFGLADAAVLGTNLIETLGLERLNGQRPAAVGPGPKASASEARAETAEAEPRYEAALERKRRLAREAYYRKRDRKLAAQAAGTELPARGPGRPRNDETRRLTRTKRFLPLEWVTEVVNQYPEGLTTKQIAERIWRTHLGGDGDPMEQWVAKAVENRVTAVREANAKRGAPMPFTIELTQGNGAMQRRTVKPLRH